MASRSTGLLRQCATYIEGTVYSASAAVASTSSRAPFTSGSAAGLCCAPSQQTFNRAYHVSPASCDLEASSSGSADVAPVRRPFLKTAHFYHRKHKGQRIAEKAAAKRERALAAGESLENVPVKPPPAVAVGAGGVPRVAAYSVADFEASGRSGRHAVSREMDVLSFKVGYCKDAQYAVPDQVRAFLLDQTTVCIFGVDKNQVSQIAAKIRDIRPPEPYKGHGIRLVGESIKLKERRSK